MKILLVGLGSIGQRHARNLRRVLGDELDLMAWRARGLPQVITDQMTIDEGATVESAYGLRIVPHLADALAERPDAVFVCNPTSLHLDVALAAARAGCHLFVEKPLADRRDGVDELVAIVERERLVAAVGYQLRFHPALLRLRALLCRQAIGRLLSVRAEMGEYLPDAHPYEDYRQSYAARADLGGGVLLCFIHEFDYVQWLFGAPRRVFASGGRLGDLELDVEDTAVSTLECAVDGRVLPVQVHLSFAQRPRARTCLITGTGGTLHLDLNAPRLTASDAGGNVTLDESFAPFDRNRLFVDEVRHFLACLRGEATPAVPLREAAVSLRIALAARESLQTNQVMELA